MYFGRQHTATLEATMLKRFTCVHCGFESLVKVLTKGEGEGTSPYLLREEGAQTAARSEAEEKARENAADLARMGTCPACQRRDESTISGLKVNTWLKGGAFALLVGAGTWFVTGRSMDGFGAWIIAAMMVGTVLVTVSKDSWKWKELGERVSVLNHQDLALELERFQQEAR